VKVLILHNAYRMRGGEDAVVEQESEMLRAHGAAVRLERIDNGAIATLADRMRAFSHAARNRGAEENILAGIARDRPDIVHIHNFFPLFGAGMHRSLHAAGLPVVQTLHNYRLLCANALFLRDGAVCEACLGGSRHHALVHRCYRGSFPATLGVLRMQNATMRDPAWVRSVSRFIALTEFAKGKFVAGGLPASRIAIKPNTTPDPGEPKPERARRGVLFVGRIAPEKGAGALIEASRALPEIPFTVIGDGPDLPRLREQAPGNVHFTGRLAPDEVMKRMLQAEILAMPSTWYEGLPMALVEAFACGLPLVAPRLGGLAETITHGADGLLYDPAAPDALANVLRLAFAEATDRQRLSHSARMTYRQRFSPERNIRQLLAIYGEALQEPAG
jgi:glycosyltransferase involved in cell wall biosynthesis